MQPTPLEALLPLPAKILTGHPRLSGIVIPGRAFKVVDPEGISPACGAKRPLVYDPGAEIASDHPGIFALTTYALAVGYLRHFPEGHRIVELAFDDEDVLKRPLNGLGQLRLARCVVVADVEVP